MRLAPIESGWTSAPLTAREVTIIVKEPLAHFRRDFEFSGVHVEDYAVSWRL